MMKLLQKLTRLEIERKVLLSQIKFDLVCNADIVSYTHKLMNQGYYHDSMLLIIDDDPIYPSRSIKALFMAVSDNLGFKLPSQENAKWIVSFSTINRLATAPYNYKAIKPHLNESVYSSFEELFDDESPLQNVQEIRNVLDEIDEAYEWLITGYCQPSYNDFDALKYLKYEFFQQCEQWICENKDRIQIAFQ